MKNYALVKVDVRAIFDGLEGEILPSLGGNSYYSGDIYIRPSNIGMAKISIVPPTIYKTRIYPTKDSYINKEKPILNFGKSSSLLVNSDKYESYLSFSLNTIPENAIIESAKLNLYKENYTNYNSIDVYSTSDQYDEIGITSLNAPNKKELLFNLVLENKSGYINTDLLYYVLDWFNKDKSTDRAFNISSNNVETIFFNSKESNNKPYIEVEYYVPTQNIGVNEVYGEISPICITNHEFDGEIYVESNIRESNAYGEIYIQNNTNSIDILEGSINIEYENSLFYDGEINIINYSNIIDIDNEILPSINNSINYYGEIDIVTQHGSCEYNGETVVQYDDRLNYNGEIDIVNQLGKSEYEGEIIVEFNNKSEYDSEINIINQLGEFQYDGEILPQINLKSNYDGDIYIKSETKNCEYDGEIYPLVPIFINYDGEINIIEQHDQCEHYGEILVIYNDAIETVGEINIISQNVEIEQYGEIYIKTITDNKFIEGEIEPAVLKYITVDGEISVDNGSYGYITFSGEIYIENGSQGYVFIL